MSQVQQRRYELIAGIKVWSELPPRPPQHQSQPAGLQRECERLVDELLPHTEAEKVTGDRFEPLGDRGAKHAIDDVAAERAPYGFGSHGQDGTVRSLQIATLRVAAFEEFLRGDRLEQHVERILWQEPVNDQMWKRIDLQCRFLDGVTDVRGDTAHVPARHRGEAVELVRVHGIGPGETSQLLL